MKRKKAKSKNINITENNSEIWSLVKNTEQRKGYRSSVDSHVNLPKKNPGKELLV